MPGRPLYRQTESTQIGELNNRVDAVERRRGPSGFYEIKIFADDMELEVKNRAFVFAIPHDLGGSQLRSAGAFVTTDGASAVTVMFENETETLDLLTTPLTIDAGELNADTAAVDAEIDTSYSHYGFPIPNNQVAARDQIAIHVLSAGGGAKGLGVMLGFS